MPLQNRADPSGSLHAVEARGLFTGNRGVIHDPETRSLTKRRWTSKAWIICDCDFGDRKREVFGRNGPGSSAGWTNLFFLDEVTALAAGHRPCFECRRARAVAFAACFAHGCGLPRVKAPEMDNRLHRQRLATGSAAQPLDADAIADLPDGAVVKLDENYLAKKDTAFREWSFEGYGLDVAPPLIAVLITPPATIAALRAGYKPVWHPSA